MMGLGPLTKAVLVTAVAALAVPLLPAPALGAQTYYVPVSRTWTVHGHGYGHGHGMSQYGAQGAAIQGLKYPAITRFYYPGTTWGTVKGTVRVLISSDTTPDVQVRSQPGLSVTDLGDGSQWTLPRGGGVDRWRLAIGRANATVVEFHDTLGWHRWRAPDGRKRFKGQGQFEGGGPVTLLVPSGSDLVGKRFRGALRMAMPYSGSTTRDTVNVLSMDQYVMGVVPYEMPTSWHQQALRAQSVAARTFAAYQRAQNPKRYYQLCDTTSCQVYGGVAAEQPRSNKAVKATAGRILTYKNRPALTQFSASSGGWTSDGGLPYLPAKKDPYDDHAGNSVHSWTAQVSVATLESAHPEIGTLVDMRVTKRDEHGAWGGRVLQIRLNGTAGVAYMTGDDFRWAFGLRSNWFSIEATPIIERWQQLGAKKSVLGKPKSGEFRVNKGAAQDFTHGRIYWRKGIGAWELSGPILAKYKAYGAQKSRLGWPTSGMRAPSAGGAKVAFQHGRIFSARRVGGAFVVYGGVLAYWAKRGAASSAFGFPISDVRELADGSRGKFEHGTITWTRSTNTVTVKMA